MLKTILKTVLLVVLIAAVALLVPSTLMIESEPLIGLIGNNDALFTLAGLPVRPFGLCMAAGALLAALAVCAMGRRRIGLDASLSLAVLSISCAVVGGHLVYCLATLSAVLSSYEEGAALLWQLTSGGYTLYGAVLGAAIALVIYCRVTGTNFAEAADALSPGAALAIAFGRAGEVFIAQGLGDYIEDEALFRFPLLICTDPDPDWPTWQIPVFLYEALAAVIILVVLLCLVRRKGRAGRLAEVFIALTGVTQVIFESLRRDDFIRFGFVRFSQIMAAISVAVVLFLRVRRCVLAGGWRPWQIVRIVLFALCVGIVILIEFALDKTPIDNLLLYGVMAATLVVMGVSILHNGRREAQA